LVSKLNQLALPKLWLPRQADFIAVDRLPILGNGKLDLRSIKALAEGNCLGQEEGLRKPVI